MFDSLKRYRYRPSVVPCYEYPGTPSSTASSPLSFASIQSVRWRSVNQLKERKKVPVTHQARPSMTGMSANSIMRLTTHQGCPLATFGAILEDISGRNPERER